MHSSARILPVVIGFSLMIAACSSSNNDEAAILGLAASMEACKPVDTVPSDDPVEEMKRAGNVLSCVMDTGNEFFFEQCGEEEVFTNIVGARMKKAMSAVKSGDGEADEEFSNEEVHELVGDCAANLWHRMQEMDVFQ